MNELGITTIDGQTAFEPGTEVTMTAKWNLEDHADSVEARLVWHTEGKGTRDMRVVDTVEFKRPSRSESREFKLQLPDAPYSFAGKVLSLLWGVELVALPSEKSARLAIVIAPGGRPVDLYRPVETNEDNPPQRSMR